MGEFVIGVCGTDEAMLIVSKEMNGAAVIATLLVKLGSIWTFAVER